MTDKRLKEIELKLDFYINSSVTPLAKELLAEVKRLRRLLVNPDPETRPAFGVKRNPDAVI